MRHAIPRLAKPPIGTLLDAGHPLTTGLIYFAPCWEAGGTNVTDVVNSLRAKFTGTIGWVPSSRSVGLLGTGTNSAALRTLPTTLTYPWPLSIACGVQTTSTAPGSSSLLFGIRRTNSGGTCIIGISPSPTYQFALRWSSGSTGVVGTNSSANSANRYYILSGTVRSGLQDLYINGTRAIHGTAAVSNPTWTSTDQYLIGGGIGGVATNCIITWAAIWSPRFPAAEHAALARNVWQIFRPFWPAAVLAQGTTVLWMPVLRPVTDRTGSRRLIWSE